MAGSTRNCFLACFLLAVAVAGCRAQCSNEEKLQMVTCLEPYDQQIIGALGVSSTCNRDAITSKGVCNAFTSIVNCMSCLSLSETECRPNAATFVDGRSSIGCRVEDFVAACTEAQNIDEVFEKTTSDCSGANGLRLSFILLLITVTVAFLSTAKD